MIRRVLVRLVIVVAVSASLLAVRLHDDPEHVRPPHVERPTAGVAAAQDEPDALGVMTDAQTLWVDNEERLQREHDEAVAAYLAGLARPNPPGSTGSGTTARVATSCDGHIIPGYILQRESGCDYGAVNPTGCSGYSCVGLYQFDLRHFTSGACAGLDWHSPADQDECARRISNDGTNLSPWR